MKKIVFLFTAILMVAFLSSCKDDKSTSPDTEQGTGFPISSGNWWKYNTYVSGPDGKPIGEIKSSYTTTVGSKITLDGREAYELISSDDPEGEDKTYISVDDNGIYSYISPEVDENDKVTPGRWLKIGDLKNMKWDIYSEVIDDEEENYTQKGTLTMKGENGGTTKVTYKGKSYNATTYYNILSRDVTFKSFNGEEWTTKDYSSKDTMSYVLIGGIGFYSSLSFDLSEGLVRNVDILVDHNLK